MLLSKSFGRSIAASLFSSFFFFFFVLFLSSTAWSQDTLTTDGFHDLGSIAPDDTICTSLPISNPYGTPATITEIFLLDSSLKGVEIVSLPTLPDTLQPGDTVYVEICLNTTESQAVFARLLMKYRFFGQEERSAEFGAYVQTDSCIAASVSSLFFGYALQGKKWYSDVAITNYSTETKTLTQVDFANDAGHKFRLITPLPMVLPPGSSKWFSVELITDEPGYRTANMTMHFDDGCTSNSIFLYGHVFVQSGVNDKQAAAHPRMIVTPNPSTGPVRIELRDALQASIEIYDALGRLVATEATPSFEWKHTLSPNGTYFVRASGVAENGTPFTITERIVLK